MSPGSQVVLIAVLAVNLVVSFRGFRALRGDSGRAERFLFIPYQVARGENGQGMLLAHFAHASVMHLAFNMLALFSFADPVLRAVGAGGFLLIYVVAGFGSDLVVFALRRDDPSYRCLGASGSVFGIVMAAIVIDPTTSVMFFFVPIPIPGPIFMLGYGVIAVVLIVQNRRSGISHEGHLGGAIAGLALGGVLAPRGLGPLIRWFAQWVS
jgi:membrane associated rhomboid family serine protease